MEMGDGRKAEFIFFDAGGTLLHPARPVGEIYGEVARHYGMKADSEQLTRCFRRVWRVFNQKEGVEAVPRKTSRGWWKCLVQKVWELYGREEKGLWESFPFDSYFEELYELFARGDCWRVYPDVISSLDGLSQKQVRLGVFSNWDERLRRILKDLELEEYFDLILISDEEGVAKPDVEFFRIGEDRCGCQGGEILLIGDDRVNDEGGARSVGWQVEVLDRPRYVVRDVLEGRGFV